MNSFSLLLLSLPRKESSSATTTLLAHSPGPDLRILPFSNKTPTFNPPTFSLTNLDLSFLSSLHSRCHLATPLIKPYSILPLCKVAGPGVPGHIPVSFPLASLSQIEKHVDSKMYHKEMQYLIQFFNLIYQGIFVTLLFLPI